MMVILSRLFFYVAFGIVMASYVIPCIHSEFRRMSDIQWWVIVIGWPLYFLGWVAAFIMIFPSFAKTTCKFIYYKVKEFL